MCKSVCVCPCVSECVCVFERFLFPFSSSSFNLFTLNSKWFGCGAEPREREKEQFYAKQNNNEHENTRERSEILRTWFRIFRNPRQFLGIIGSVVVVVAFFFVLKKVRWCIFVVVVRFSLSSSSSLLTTTTTSCLAPQSCLHLCFLLFFVRTFVRVLTGIYTFVLFQHLIVVGWQAKYRAKNCMMQVAARCNRLSILLLNA